MTEMAPFNLPVAAIPELEFAGLKAQYAALKPQIAARMACVFRHGQFIMGPEVAELEAALAEFAGVGHVVTVSSGTDAITAPMMALGVGPGDAVFLPAFTFPATAEVPVLLGAEPVFVDVDPRTYNIDPAGLESEVARVAAEGRLRPKAVIPVDLFGLPADYPALAAIAARHGMTVVADAAQSFGATLDGRMVGGLAPVTATSFFPAKPLGCYGDGGAVLTDDGDLAEALKSIRAHGRGREKYAIDRIGLNARLDTLQAAVLLAKLPSLTDEIAARQRLADLYDRHLAEVTTTPSRSNAATSAFAQYTIQVDHREAVQAQLKAAGVPSAIYYPRPMHMQAPYAGYAAGPGSLPSSERLAGRVLSLPIHGYMDDAVAERIAVAVRDAILATG